MFAGLPFFLRHAARCASGFAASHGTRSTLTVLTDRRMAETLLGGSRISGMDWPLK